MRRLRRGGGLVAMETTVGISVSVVTTLRDIQLAMSQLSHESRRSVILVL